MKPPADYPAWYVKSFPFWIVTLKLAILGHVANRYLFIIYPASEHLNIVQFLFHPTPPLPPLIFIISLFIFMWNHQSRPLSFYNPCPLLSESNCVDCANIEKLSCRVVSFVPECRVSVQTPHSAPKAERKPCLAFPLLSPAFSAKITDCRVTRKKSKCRVSVQTPHFAQTWKSTICSRIHFQPFHLFIAICSSFVPLIHLPNLCI